MIPTETGFFHLYMRKLRRLSSFPGIWEALPLFKMPGNTTFEKRPSHGGASNTLSPPLEMNLEGLIADLKQLHFAFELYFHLGRDKEQCVFSLLWQQADP